MQFPKEQLVIELRKKGVYFTHLVKELVNILTESNELLSVREILEKFSVQSFFPYASSLHRQLVRLAKLEVIKDITFSDGIKRYCFVIGDKPHYYFECRDCGSVTLFTSDPNQAVDVAEGELNGYQITDRTILFKGYCLSCIKLDSDSGYTPSPLYKT